jgi:predicted MFS family arabinose efflux permease
MVRDRFDAARDALSEPNLRRLNLAYAVTQLGSWAAFIAVSVFAFAHGGAREVGVMTAVRLAPTVIAAPFAGLLADRYARRRVIVGIELTRALAQTLAALLVLEHSAPVGVYLAVALASLADTGVDPARAALLPSLARTPQQLTAANALEATVDGAALTLGPAIGALLLSFSSVQVVLFASTGAALAAVLLVARIDGEALGHAVVSGFRQSVRQSLAGFGTIARDRTLRVVVGLFAAQMLAFGLLLVFVVAIPLEELHTSASGVGWLNAAAGVGAICGGLLTVTLTGAGLTRPLAIGMCLISLGYALVAAFAVEPIAFAALLTMNLGACYVDVATFTLLQRAVPQDVLARAFSVVQTIIVTALLAGGLIAPALISALGLRGALAVTAAAVLACIGFAYPALRRIDASAGAPLEPLGVLRKLALFRTLPAPVLERLAAGLLEREAARGEEVVTQGRPADGYYVVRAGSAEVLVDGARVATLGPGDGFGEVALLLDSPRTATVRALEHIQLGYLDRELFLATVSGHDESREAGSALAQAALARSSPAGRLM